MMKKYGILYKRSRLFSVFALCFILAFSALPAAAESQDFTLSDEATRLPIPQAFSLETEIYNAGNFEDAAVRFSEPDDLFLNDRGELFIADTGNNRVVKLDANHQLAGVFYGPEDKPLSGPRGVYADADGNMYIADTGNERILHLDSQGNFVEEFVKPESDLLSDDFIFDPTKIAVGNNGYLYVLKGESIMAIDAYNRFAGYIGQNKIGFSIKEALIRMFASQSQIDAMTKRRATSYINFTLDDKDLIYGTALDPNDGEIKKLNAVGDNVFRKYQAEGTDSMLSIFTPDLIEPIEAFAEQTDDNGQPMQPYFADIAIGPDGLVYAVETNTCRVYQYDAEGTVLAAFGGIGDEKGKFRLPSALEVDAKGNVYVLDKAKNCLSIFSPTEFNILVQQASVAYQNGEYERSYSLWEQVSHISASYPTAYTGMGQNLYQQKEYAAAMQVFAKAGDAQGYSSAFAKQRHQLFRQYILLVAILAIVVLAAVVVLYKVLHRVGMRAVDRQMNRTVDHNTIRNGFGLMAGVLFRPYEMFSYLRRDRGKIRLLPPLIILVLMSCVRLLSILLTHFPLASVEVKDANWGMEVLLLVVPLLSWTIASYAVTSVVGGESRFSEVFFASCYCMIPYCLFTLPITAFSNLLSRNEAGLYGLLLTVVTTWTLVLFILSVKSLNGYSVGKTLVVCLLSIVAIALLWLTVFLLAMLCAQVLQFVAGIGRELRYM